MSKDQQQLSDCGCCEGLNTLTPASIENRPGLSAIKYRVGTHRRFKSSMFTRLAAENALYNLTTRSDDDLAIGLLDAWATVADVLTFYQERIANEGFLRTAKERRSILELARSIGYELRPGVAASTFLAFTLEDAPGLIEKTIIEEGTKVQSLPAQQGQMPQIFETIETIEAMQELNELKPRLTCPQIIDERTETIYFEGINTQLKPGDGLLVEKIILNFFTVHIFFKIVSVKTEPALSRTYVDVILIPSESTKTTTATLSIPTKTSVYAFRVKTGLFGHNAPKFKTLPDDLQNKLGDWDADSFKDPETGSPIPPAPIPINMRPLVPPEHVNWSREYYDGPKSDGKLIYLDNTYPKILPDSWVVLLTLEPRRVDDKDITIQYWKAYGIEKTREETLSEFLLSAKVTGLTLKAQNVDEISKMILRKTTCYAQSEVLTLVEQPYEKPIERNTVTLDRKVNGLKKGQLISITGETMDTSGEETGLTKSEIAVVSQIKWIDEFSTQISFVQNLEYRYKRDTVVLNANVAKATHGETKQEILGSGDPSQLQQQIILKQKPLTFISAPTNSGSKSTLEVRVNDILWKEVRFLYNLKADDNTYVVRIENDGQARIIFGDGIRGARPPAGLENITAKYRIGIGTSGILDEGQLSLLMSKPLGVKSVTNPIVTSGAEDSENLENARQNAPLTVLTMERIVSLMDFENFARAFAGIGKAMGIWIWDGEKRRVHLTVASSTGPNHQIEPNSELYQNLVKAIDKAKDPVTYFQLDSFSQLSFNLEAKILVSKDREPERVLVAVKNALNEKFSFESRQFGQPVSLSEVKVIIQHVEGVLAVDVDFLYLSEEEPKLNKLIPSHIARYHNGTILLSELLVLNPAGVTLITEAANT
jgi:hypothetical protein